ncbi:MAG: hypothetical protein KA116_11420 [Proteobacteria bacterium]|nr:hypothetical protein [Pseudomonadota bacterium]
MIVKYILLFVAWFPGSGIYAKTTLVVWSPDFLDEVIEISNLADPSDELTFLPPIDKTALAALIPLHKKAAQSGDWKDFKKSSDGALNPLVTEVIAKGENNFRSEGAALQLSKLAKNSPSKFDKIYTLTHGKPGKLFTGWIDFNEPYSPKDLGSLVKDGGGAMLYGCDVLTGSKESANFTKEFCQGTLINKHEIPPIFFSGAVTIPGFASPTISPCEAPSIYDDIIDKTRKLKATLLTFQNFLNTDASLQKQKLLELQKKAKGTFDPKIEQEIFELETQLSKDFASKHLSLNTKESDFVPKWLGERSALFPKVVKDLLITDGKTFHLRKVLTEYGRTVKAIAENDSSLEGRALDFTINSFLQDLGSGNIFGKIKPAETIADGQALGGFLKGIARLESIYASYPAEKLSASSCSQFQGCSFARMRAINCNRPKEYLPEKEAKAHYLRTGLRLPEDRVSPDWVYRSEAVTGSEHRK